MRQLSSVHVTLALALAVTTATVLSSTAAPAHHTMAAKKSSAVSLVSQGKTLGSTLRCNACHAADYSGKKGFSPSLRTKGVLREYNKKTWETVLDTGVTNDGGKVKSPMPVYHLKAAKSDALYAYLKTLK